MRVLSIGEMVIDFIPGNEPNSFIRKAGGAPANVAIALARQNINASFCGLVGNDDFGRFLLKTLLENNVKPCLSKRCDEAITTMAFVSLDDTGNRSFTFARKPGADMFLSREMIEERFITDSDLVHFGSCSLSKNPAADATLYTIQKAHECGKLISLDINYRNLMWEDDRAAATTAVRNVLPYVDFLKFSDDEADIIGDENDFFKIMKENKILLMVETFGANGAKCYWNDKVIESSSFKAKCVDSCGAGDAFWGSFLACLLKSDLCEGKGITEETISHALQNGNIGGYLCVQKKGAIESLPTEEEMERCRREVL